MSHEIKFSKLSYELTKKINKNDKKNNGIYFTPPKTILTNIELLKPFISNFKNVLEPSCGSCEYILQLNKLYQNLDITGIEFNKTIFKSIKKMENDKIKLLNENFLTYDEVHKYDLIIGNPPYYVMKKKDVDKSYYDYFTGRPNIFILFIIKSLKMLNDNGILSFVLPKNFLNCLYYDKTRNFISQYFKIINIVECNDDYIETKQDTIILIVQKPKKVKEDETNTIIDNSDFIINKETYTIFGTKETIININKLYVNTTTLHNLNFKVNVGNVVWNQCKKILTDDESKTLLIYSSDIKNKKLKIKKYSNKDKKNYINKVGNTNPVLVINRGYGVGNYSFEYCLIDIEKEYLIENHLICVNYTKNISYKKLIKLYKMIIKSFENENTKKFIELYFGNNAINTTELCEILPIYN